MLSDFLKKTINIIKEQFNSIKSNFEDAKKNIGNLEEVNLNLAIRFINENKLEEAFTRLKIMHLLWADNIDGTYFYSLLLILSKKNEKAINIINNHKYKDNEDLQKMLYIAENHDMDYILNLIDKNDINLSEIKNVL